MTRIYLSAFMAALLWLASAACPAAAQEAPALGKWWRAPRVAQELGLTPSETRRLDRLYLEMSQERIRLRSQIQQARLVVDNLFDQQPLDQAAIDQQFQRIAEAQSELAMTQSRFLLEVRKILGRERFQDLRQIFQRFRRRFPAERRRRPRY